MFKWIAIVLGVLLLITNGFWFYSAVDLASSEKYRQQEEYEAKHKTEALKNLCSKLVSGMQKNAAIKLLNEISPEFKAYEKEGRINTIWVSLKIDEQGKVIKHGACK